MLHNEIIKGTDTPVIIRANGVNFPSYDNILVTIGTESYSKQSNPTVIVTDTDDVTLLEIRVGNVTSLAVGTYLLKITIVNADYPNGNVLTDCVRENLKVTVRNQCT